MKKNTSKILEWNVSYMQAAAKFTIVPHLDVDPLIQTESDQIQWLLNRIGGWLLQNT